MTSFDWAVKAYKEGAVFTAIDIETTGLDPHLDKIVELGAVKFDKDGIIARFAALVNPGIPMPAEAERVNNISDEMLKDKPSLEEVLPEFLSMISDTILLAHNVKFDCGFINAKLKKSHRKSKSSWKPPYPALPNPLADTLHFSREKFRGFRSYSLQNLARELKIKVKDAHRAEGDAIICMEILKKIVGVAE